MLVKIIKSYRDVIVICDSDLIGKTFENETQKLEIKESFYKGEENSPQKVEKIMEDMLKEDATFNIVGKESVNLAIKKGIIKKEKIKEVQGVPIALKLI